MPLHTSIILPILLFYFNLFTTTSATEHQQHPLPFHRKGIGLLSSLKSYIPHPTANGTPRPSTANCSIHWFTQTIDHFFSSSPSTFQQRYFLNTKYWTPSTNNPILLYTGNEANVELYINATGFMWEHAQSLNAALLFIEHRYYGQSLPFNTSQEEDMRRDGRLQFLTVEQALKDYIVILAHFKEVYGAEESPVIALGGSYGGMLAAWIRMEYPDDVHGAIASSAPLLAFFDDSYKNGDTSTMLRGFAHGESYWQIVTIDASEKGGSICECSSNVHSAFGALFHLSTSSKHLQRLTELFHLCQPLQTSQDVHKLALMYLFAWDTMAMGNYPFPSNYMILEQTKDANVTLPPFPVRAACDCMSGTYPIQFNNSNDNFLDDNIINLLSALRDAGSLYYNATGTTKCNNLPSDVNFDGIWDYQYCTQLLPQETYFERDGIHDMFWPFVVSRAEIEEHCIQAFPSLNKPSSSSGNGVNWNWLQDMYKKAKETLTNVVFTNGAYDPWSAGGIVPPGWSESVPSFVIEEGGHHLDLMFSDVEHDPESVVRVRKMEVEFIEKWIAEEKEKKRKRKWMYQKEGLLRGELSTN